MNEIVPPKLNKDTGLLSLALNRNNFLVLTGILISFAIWTTQIIPTVDQKIFATIVAGFLLMPFLFDAYGRPVHKLLIDGVKFMFSSKKARVVLSKDVSEGIVIVSDYQYSRVYRIEPINLSMSGREEIVTFKQYIQQALFSLANPIQIITVQKESIQDAGLAVEMNRFKNLTGKLHKCCQQYLLEYQDLTQTVERYFYIVFTTYAKGLDDAKRKLEEQENSFGKLLEQTKIRLIPLSTNEVLDLANYVMNKKI